MQVLNQHRVLVLNRLWQAVNICSLERALALLYMDHAHVVHEDDDGFNILSFKEWMLHSPAAGREGEDVIQTISSCIRVPQVILLRVFDRMPLKEVKITRDHIFQRDDFICQYCRKKIEKRNLSIDHVVPRMRGGKTTWNNVVTACLPCNQRKAHRTPEEAGMRLLRDPKKPKWRPFIESCQIKRPHVSWSRFLNLNHWKVDLGDPKSG